MVNKTKIIYSNKLDPWWNIAIEGYLLDRVEADECILYLWQNQNTVVIGRNQNAWRECRTDALERDGGKLARRLSGGGAVFHDTGNLNFTFLINKENYNLERQVGTILAAVRKVGILAEKTGRNDIAVDGRKFSGNAFYFKKSNAYHHGTILVAADMSKLGNYLQVSEDKIKSKGVQSVQSRVINLTELQPSLTINDMMKAFAEAFKEEYGGDSTIIDNLDWMEQDVLQTLYKKFESWQWRYGATPNFDIDFSTRFSWGGVEIGLKLSGGKVEKASVYSDALDAEFIEMLPNQLQGRIFHSPTLVEGIRQLEVSDERRQMLKDIVGWIEEKGF